MKPPRVKVGPNAPAGCVVAAFFLWLVGLALWLSLWGLVIVVLWKLAHHL